MAENPVERKLSYVISIPLPDQRQMSVRVRLALDFLHISSVQGSSKDEVGIYLLHLKEHLEQAIAKVQSDSDHQIQIACTQAEDCEAKWHYFSCPHSKGAA